MKTSTKQDIKALILAYVGIFFMSICCIMDMQNGLMMGETIVESLPALGFIFMAFLLFDSLRINDETLRLRYYIMMMYACVVIAYVLEVPILIWVIGVISIFIGLFAWFYVKYKGETKKCLK